MPETKGSWAAEVQELENKKKEMFWL